MRWWNQDTAHGGEARGAGPGPQQPRGAGIPASADQAACLPATPFHQALESASQLKFYFGLNLLRSSQAKTVYFLCLGDKAQQIPIRYYINIW